MAFLEKLKHLIKVDLRNLINVRINITVNKDSPVSLGSDKRVLNIDLEGLPAAEKGKVLEAIKDTVEKDGSALIETSAEKIVREIKHSEQLPEMQKILEALRDYIPSSDLPILRAALYIRKKFKEGPIGSVKPLKDDIFRKYGDRGAKISNLCSAGYIESMIIPLLEDMKSDLDFSRERFQQSYETIVVESGFAVFVHAAMSKEQIRREALEKIKTGYKYGQRRLHIHGIGKANIENVREVADQLTCPPKTGPIAMRVSG
ncbi:MAG: hypothetical protein HYZ90_02035 [Candidatus Omnitrophica bacterium]|nr:hypothetical protein [Candidatus Omnitrophota bacterium]